MTEAEQFASVADPFRHELLTYCYRMLGSIHDAEDLVQETYLRAWRSYDRFEGRASLRTWLYRIATNACLSALESRSRRPLPSGLGAPSDAPEGPLDPPLAEVTWLQPIPTALLTAESSDPAAIVASRAGVRLALIAALQYLSARQRAVLVLRDVLGWRASETAELLETTTAAVNSILQRARAQLRRMPVGEAELAEPDDPNTRQLLDRYAKALENTDVSALMQLLSDDVTWEMPPRPTWFAGRDDVVRLVAFRNSRPGDVRMVPTSANGQPGFAFYTRAADGVLRARSVQVLTVVGARITKITAFHQPTLFPTFGLPGVFPGQD